MMFRASAMVGLLAMLAGCAGEAGKAAPAAPDLSAGKQDGLGIPVLGALVFGAATTGTLSKNGEFHAWQLDVRAGATVKIELTHKGSSSALDATMFVYAPDGAGGHLPVPVAFDDDSGWGMLPRLSHTFTAEGPHLVVIGSYDGIGKGAYRLLATCTSLACEAAPAEPAGPACHPALLTGMKGCVQDWRWSEDPDMTRPPTASELTEWCTDAEPIAPLRDAACESEAPPTFCALPYEDFVTQEVPPCRAELLPWVEETACVFGAWFHKVADSAAWGLVETGRSVIDDAAGLTELEAARVVAALHASAHDDVTTATEAILRTDDHELLRIALWDATVGRAYESYTFHSGDNLFGVIFAHGTVDAVARINDGDIMDCTARPGPMLLPCAKSGDCAAGLACVGASTDTFDGRCVSLEVDGEGAACSADVPCPDASGLVCAGASLGGEGLCAAAWTRASFRDVSYETIPESAKTPLERTIQAAGLLTVTTDVWVRLTIAHPKPSQLRVALINPAGTEAVVWEGDSAGPDLVLDKAVAGFPGDESANGPWILRVTDLKKGDEGTLSDWTLTLGSRWD